MANLHGLSSNVGLFMIIVGLIFAFPIFALIQIISIDVIWEVVLENTNWNSWLVIGITFFICVPTLAMLFAYGADMIKFRDKRIDDIESIDEKADKSKYKPAEPEYDVKD